MALYTRAGRGEISDQRIGITHILGESRIVFAVAEVDGAIAQAGTHPREDRLVPVRLGHIVTQALLDVLELLDPIALITRERHDPGVVMQQTFTIQLIQGREKFAQGEVAQRAEDCQGTG
ncbi:hypothetical protein QE440_004451 [Pseudomonas psychrotolerans]|uniref:Uncharacterized protein n=1 Tax=Pseudomonas oryzihabitans TaxID=47885 RepID=A0AAJ2BQQ8_9PSED|nr:hypothetical protein [Pseudomonas psychrotolerans]